MSETPQIHAQKPVEISLGAQWEYDTRGRPALANQVLIQHAMPDGSTGKPTGMYIRLGHVNPPIFTGEMSQEVAQTLGPLPVVVVGDFYLPLQSVIALRDSLNEALRNAGISP